MTLEEKLNKVKKFRDEISHGIRDLFIGVGAVMGADYLIPLPTDYWKGMAPGFDLAIGSGLLNARGERTWASVFGLALSMTPELIYFTINPDDYGNLSSRALSKGAVYGITSLLAIGANKLYQKLKSH